MCGVACLGLNGGDAFRQSEAFSFQIATEDLAETDRYWNVIVNNGGRVNVAPTPVFHERRYARDLAVELRDLTRGARWYTCEP